MLTTLVLFSGTMLSAIVGALVGVAVGSLIFGIVGAWLNRRRAAVSEGWSITDLIRGGLWGAIPGLIAGGLLGFRWLVSWLAQFPA